jgi:hypothetical protein
VIWKGFMAASIRMISDLFFRLNIEH